MTDLQPCANGTDQRLDLVLDELRAIRAALAPVAVTEPKDGEAVELKEPATKPPEKAKAKRT